LPLIPIAVKRFLREAEFGARVVHPNVVRTFDFGEAEGVYYLALEWAPGEPLESFLNKAGTLAAPVAARIVEQLGGALEQAHKAGIIHRDLKPANIMYDPEAQQARLLDFGIARDAEIGAEERLTRAGFFVGTLQYVAPEALSGELVGEQADVYSLAVIAYQMLTGVTPFPGKNPRELFQQLLTESPIASESGQQGAQVLVAARRGRDEGARPRPRPALEDGDRLHARLRRGPRPPSRRRRASSPRSSSADAVANGHDALIALLRRALGPLRRLHPRLGRQVVLLH
jgi:serine/threonine protein kinase